MRDNNKTAPIVVSGSAALVYDASFVSDPIYVAEYSIGAVTLSTGASDTAIGTLTLEFCDDLGPRTEPRGGAALDITDWLAETGATLTNWVTQPGALNLPGTPQRFDIPRLTPRWMRVRWVNSSGTGTGTGRVILKVGG